MTPQRYEILKNLTMKSAPFLPLRSSGKRDEGVEVLLPLRLSSEVCEVEGGVIPPMLHGGLHLPGHLPPLHTLTASMPSASCANALSIQQAPQEAPGKSRHTIFLPRLIFIQGCLSHTATLEGCYATSVSSFCPE